MKRGAVVVHIITAATTYDRRVCMYQLELEPRKARQLQRQDTSADCDRGWVAVDLDK